jgi:hypothetical protein
MRTLPGGLYAGPLEYSFHNGADRRLTVKRLDRSHRTKKEQSLSTLRATVLEIVGQSGPDVGK